MIHSKSNGGLPLTLGSMTILGKGERKSNRARCRTVGVCNVGEAGGWMASHRPTALWLALLFCLASPISAQDTRTAAENALEAIGPVTDLLTTPNMEATVTPYETDAPPETGLTNNTLPDAITDVKSGSGADNGAWNASVNSVVERPDVAPADTALGLADTAVENAEGIAGRYFSASDTPNCTDQVSLLGQAGTQFCTAVLSPRTETCSETRRITVDRDDTWTCTEGAATYETACVRPVSWQCTGTSGGTCRKSRIAFSRAATWDSAGSTARVDFGSAGASLFLNFQVERFTLKAGSGFTPGTVSISRIDWRSMGRLRINGVLVWPDYAANPVPGSATGTMNPPGWGSAPTYTADWTQFGLYGNTLAKSATVNFDLTNLLNVPKPGPSTDSGNALKINTGTYGPNISIEVLSVVDSLNGWSWTNPGTPAGIPFGLTFSVTGNCCSEFTATAGASC